jgi:short-subunit dehydrogenase
MSNNYLTAAFSAQVTLKLWAEEHETAKAPEEKLDRHIVFINSVAAFCTVPGMSAYSGKQAWGFTALP